jgi:hypothetical protein
MKETWTSMAKISGDKNNLILRGFSGAYVWIAAQALGSDQFKQSIELDLQKLALTLVALEEIRTANDVELSDDPSHELLTLIARARKEENSIAYGNFYPFTHGDN